jgi:hypothetical protein
MRPTHWTKAPSFFLLALGILAVSASVLAADPPQARDKTTAPIIRSIRSGPWSAAATWEGGKVPGAEARVLIQTGHRITYDVNSSDAIRAINVAGALVFATDKDTRLDVGLIKIQDAAEYSEDGFDCEAHLAAPDPKKDRPALEVGTADRPIDAGHTATIRLVYFPGMDKQSCPAIVCCGGRMDFHGTPMARTWVKLGGPAKKGTSSLTLAEAVPGWRVGDRVIVTRTLNPDYARGLQTEERIIREVHDTTLVLDQPLVFDHAAGGEFRGEVANLSRNVIVESADPGGVRGHTMYHRHSAGGISYAEFRHLGKQGVLGRYSIHYHLVGDTMRGSYVLGASIWDSHNRWVTIHGTNHLIVRDCVGYRSIGHGFFFEDGSEVDNVLDRNLAVQARRGKPLPKQVLPFDANDGAGFWWANSRNAFTRNVSSENGLYGYRFEASRDSRFNLTLPIRQPDGSHKNVDIRTLPFIRFEDNEAHSDGIYGFNLGEGVERVGPDARHPFVIRGMKIWEIHYAFRPQSPCVLVEDMHIDRSVYGVYHPNYDRHVYRNLTINGNGDEPFNRGHDDISVQYGPLTVDGLTFGAVGGYPYSIPLIQMSDNNPTGKAVSHFRNLKVLRADAGNRRPVVNTGGGLHITPETPKGVPVYLHDYYGPGRHARVAAINARDYGDDGLKYHDEKPLTGHESRVVEVHDVEFPALLDPVDDYPPVTVITHARRVEKGTVIVRGTTVDNGTVRRVLVNGKEARSVTGNFLEWEAVLDGVPGGELKLEAHAEDAAGNIEQRPHEVILR